MSRRRCGVDVAYEAPLLRLTRPAKFFALWAFESGRAVAFGAVLAVAITGPMGIGTNSRLSVGAAVGGR